MLGRARGAQLLYVTFSTTATVGATLTAESVGVALVELAGAARRGTPGEYRELKGDGLCTSSR
jgi:hypothetical protein